MEFNPYRVLVQLIPGSLFLGIILLNEIGIDEIGLLNIAGIIFLGILSIIIGYIFNGLGHLLEMLFYKKKLEIAIQKNLINPKNGGFLILLFRRFSVVSMDESISAFDKTKNLKLYNTESRAWSKEENKFARTLIIMSVFLLIYIYSYDLICLTKEIWFYVQVMLWLLFIISIYRYIVSCIDYSYKRKNKTT